MSKFKEAVATLLKNGCEQIEVEVVSATPKIGDSYTRISCEMNKKVARYLPNDDGDYEKRESNSIPILISYISKAMKYSDVDDVAAIASYCENNPKAMAYVLTHAKMTILLQEVGAHSTYTDPFSEKSPEKENEEDYTTIYYYVASIDLKKHFVNKVLDKMLEF